MYFLQAGGFSWEELLMGSEDWNFLWETILRSFIMFVIILVSLRILGKRGVKQLSVFELVVIIGLGSAAGDPMFYKDVGIVPAIIVFSMIVGLYRLITFFVGQNKKFEALIEGKPVCLIEDGSFAIENFKKEVLGEDEFFSELRLQGVSQLGQVQQAIVEVSGSISIFFYPDNEVKYGLPIMPGSLQQPIKIITHPGHYSCIFCGNTQTLTEGRHKCRECKKDEWVASSNRKRIA
ncbi:MAG: DUF421 domain-containing protein [Chitinophagaceae bacterium]|nr:MAG: DUF421 domain-containing protein [Chitinophagaceae bacterium]